MCCKSEMHHGGCDCGRHHGSCQCGCGCGGHGGCCAHGRHSPSDRVFWTKAEKIAWLEEYAESLRDELKAVEERINMLQAE